MPDVHKDSQCVEAGISCLKTVFYVCCIKCHWVQIKVKIKKTSSKKNRTCCCTQKMLFPKFFSKCKIINTVKVPSVGQSEGRFICNHLASVSFTTSCQWWNDVLSVNIKKPGGGGVSVIRAGTGLVKGRLDLSSGHFGLRGRGLQKVGYNAWGVFVPSQPPPPGQWPKNMGRPCSLALSLHHPQPPAPSTPPHYVFNYEVRGETHYFAESVAELLFPFDTTQEPTKSICWDSDLLMPLANCGNNHIETAQRDGGS